MKDSCSKIAPSTGYELLPEQEDAAESLQRPKARFLIGCIVAIVTILSVALVLLLIFTISPSHKVLGKRSPCPNPAVRQEWRTLSVEARQSYIAAVQCLSNSPSRLGLNTTRYDDFVYSHLATFDDVHHVAGSFPWHRWYIQQYEDALRNECGYEGNLAYWDWTLDAADVVNSPIWSDESGFGGNGSSPDHCLTDGPLAQMAPQYPEPHCLTRNFSVENMHGMEYTPAIVEDIIVNAKTYHEFRFGLEDGPHAWLHRGIGGEMELPWSTNDPIFFLHHAQIDRLWWKWQHLDPNGRIRDYDAMTAEDLQDLQNRGDFEVKDGDEGEDEEDEFEVLPVSLRDRVNLYGLGADVLVEDVMSTETSLLCYRYPD